MSSRLQPALPGASHELRGSCTADPPHLALPWTPVATLQAFGQGDAYVNTQYFLWRKTVEDVIPVTSDRQNSRRDQPCVRHQNTHTPHTYTHITHIHTHIVNTASHVARYVPALARLLIAEQPVNCTPA